MSDDEIHFDIGRTFGANDSTAIQRLVAYVPDRGRSGNAIDPEPWLGEVETLFAKIGGGFTRQPPVIGGWLDPGTDQLVREQTTLVYTYVDPERLRAIAPALRAVFHRFGRATGQGEVAFEFDGYLYRITEYDA